MESSVAPLGNGRGKSEAKGEGLFPLGKSRAKRRGGGAKATGLYMCIPEFEAGPKCDLQKTKTVKSCDLKKDKSHFGHQTGGATVCVSACEKGVTEVKKIK